VPVIGLSAGGDGSRRGGDSCAKWRDGGGSNDVDGGRRCIAAALDSGRLESCWLAGLAGLAGHGLLCWLSDDQSDPVKDWPVQVRRQAEATQSGWPPPAITCTCLALGWLYLASERWLTMIRQWSIVMTVLCFRQPAIARTTNLRGV
jgi:hypothetical protein